MVYPVQNTTNKGLYEDCKGKLAALEADLTPTITRYNDITKRDHGLELECVRTFHEYHQDKDNQIKNLKETVEDYDKKFGVLISEHKSKIQEYEEMLKGNPIT